MCCEEMGVKRGSQERQGGRSLRNTNICSARQYLINAGGTQQPRALRCRGAEVNGGKNPFEGSPGRDGGQGHSMPRETVQASLPNLQGQGEGDGE